ncbi:DUF1269 domain-containing protein [Limnoraphis robusta]|uniref:DUF1269 domain-containing protein n=1 Tax=Limnoraphis robusta CCNP1315 TaxID=3110306 RepID=A0ABU5TY11_9CYAN|nr:DUF1269 domain-containing protein [Limnoraphis robusta]MEA5519600.1 DUF1269 domain-containing protein [Limnoraphis robusta CCNP1315]MEA5545095.1 DUF1269 domain-containing protein [Limnoraphis robusta CCNP1324]
MANLTVWKFNSPDGAENALAKLKELQKQHLITIVDAAVVTWPEGKKKPKTKQAVDITSLSALDGAFWGMLFGLIFFVPILGMAMGALAGALSGHFSDYGINDDFIKDVRSKVTEGTSALFLMSEKATVDKVLDAMTGEQTELIQSNLSQEQEDKLKEHFSLA